MVHQNEVDEVPGRCHRCGRPRYGPHPCDCEVQVADAPESAVASPKGSRADVRDELAKWRRIRGGAWVRKRVLTGDAGPVEPTSTGSVTRSLSGGRRASEPKLEALELPTASMSRAARLDPVEDTAEVEALAAALDEPERARHSRAGAVILVALLFIGVVAGLTWAIAVLA